MQDTKDPSSLPACECRLDWLLSPTDELYKAAKLEANADVKSKGKEPMVEDQEEDDGEAGPELPPDFDAEDIPDDEEGRFFGGGMERETAQAMNYIDEQDQGETTVGDGASEADQADRFRTRNSTLHG